MYNFGKFDHVKVLSTCETYLRGTSPNCGLQVIKELGMVNCTIYRRVYLDQDLSVSSDPNNKSIALNIEKALQEVVELMRSKVAAINGNCILGFNTHIFQLKEEHYYSQAIFLALTATGDAVELSLVNSSKDENDSG